MNIIFPITCLVFLLFSHSFTFKSLKSSASFNLNTFQQISVDTSLPSNDAPRNVVSDFLAHVTSSLNDGSLEKLSLFDRKLAKTIKSPLPVSQVELLTVDGRCVELKSDRYVQLQYKYESNDQFKNFAVSDVSSQLQSLFVSYGFRKATLRTNKNIYELNIRFGDGTLRKVPYKPQIELNLTNLVNAKELLQPTTTATTTALSSTLQPHDRIKNKIVESSEEYLKALKILTPEGKPYTGMTDKYNQINKFIEILNIYMKKSTNFNSENSLNIVDMGCGLSYLTFASFAHISKNYPKVKITGVESRMALNQRSNDKAKQLNYKNLRFINSNIIDFGENLLLKNKTVDIMLGLHACDTATDEAIYYGIKLNSEIIMMAPCCQKEIRIQLEQSINSNSNSNRNKNKDEILRYGIYRERYAEMLTDTVRSMILEYYDYDVNVSLVYSICCYYVFIFVLFQLFHSFHFIFV